MLGGQPKRGVYWAPPRRCGHYARATRPSPRVRRLTYHAVRSKSPNAANNTSEARTTPHQTVNDPSNNGKGDKKDKDERSKETEDQRRSRAHTNQGGADQYATSGQVAAVERSPDGGYLLASI